ncbi:helix-turn-helix domain-containing protein [Alloyangia pacifica]|uniref:Replication protein C N-terminal domain-containing protein n=1 Tax=Alloyangia pacifica TaxID=311180 RepID=A0A1I6W6H4_9RHOB|nr:helix-turn-helix domain-containing protein [Alloyangia pacifica]SDI66323.1 Replication protein C N-terminal domain-containing protein [Alloyangia pacifica]SFT21598.1 Replication protein C N-terminal domain-containing protein [Alloyangia pacifica]
MTVMQQWSHGRQHGPFPTLPSGMERDGFVNLVDAIASAVGIGAAAMMTFRAMIGATRPRSFKTGAEEPCCYLSQTELARKRGVSPCRIRAHEQVLERAGLIEKRTMANGARSGFAGCGVFFGRGIARVQEFLGLRDALEKTRRAHGQLRGLRSAHKRRALMLLAELADWTRGDEITPTLRAELDAWPSAAKLHRMSVEELTLHEAEAAALCRKIAATLSEAPTSSGRACENERPLIQDMTQDPTQGVSRVSAKAVDDARHTDDIELGDRSYSDQDKHPKEAGAEGELLSRGQAGERQATFLGSLGPERLYALCSQEMQLHLDMRRYGQRQLVFYDFVVSAQNRLPEMGAHPAMWRELRGAMGSASAAICVLIADAKHSERARADACPAGVLEGMLRDFRRGDLDLVRALAEIGRPQRTRK